MTRFLCFLLLVVASHVYVLSGEMTLEASRRHPTELPGEALRSRPETASRSGEGVKAAQRPAFRPQLAAPTPVELPPPLYESVLELELAQQAESQVACPADRLLVTELAPGFDSLLLMLQAGLTIARLTRRTLVLPSLEPLHRRRLELGDILNLKELTSFWHCVIEQDALERQARLAEVQSAAAAAGGTGGSGSEGMGRSLHGLLQDELQRRRVAIWAAQQAGNTVQQYAEWALQDPAAAQALVLLVPRHLAGKMCGGEAAWDEAFWRRVRPSPRVALEVAAVQQQRLGGQESYAAMHMARGLAGYCHRLVNLQFEPGQLRDAVHATCSPNATLMRAVFAAQGWPPAQGGPAAPGGRGRGMPAEGGSLAGAGLLQRPSRGRGGGGGGEGSGEGAVFVATEAWTWRQHRLPSEALAWPGGVAYCQPVLPANGSSSYSRWPRELVQGIVVPEVYAPAVELFLVVGAEVAVGSLASRMAVIAANIRATYMKPTVLAWPEPAQQAWPFWECGRYHYCAGTHIEEEDTPQQQGDLDELLQQEQAVDARPLEEQLPPLRQQKSTCYPAQAW